MPPGDAHQIERVTRGAEADVKARWDEMRSLPDRTSERTLQKMSNKRAWRYEMVQRGMVESVLA